MQTTTQLRELTIRYTVRTDVTATWQADRRVSSPTDCAEMLGALLRDQPCEVFLVLLLSTRHHVLAFHEVSRGSLDATIVHPREVFKAAFLANAAAIVLAHNHPSGDPTPSADDVGLTHRLARAGELLGIPVLDHVIVGHDRHYSMKESGLLPK